MLGAERSPIWQTKEAIVIKPRIHLITLAVDDLERSLAFYRDGLGLESEGLIGTEYQGDEMNPTGTIALFRLGGGMVLSLFPRSELAKDAHVPFAAGKAASSASGMPPTPERRSMRSLLGQPTLERR